MPRYEQVVADLKRSPRSWLVTGVAGFIGSNLLETLLSLDQRVVGLDNFATGHRRNLAEVSRKVGEERARNFRFIEGDIRDLDTCRAACEDVDYVLHQAALGSVPRSIEDPIATNQANIDGFLNMLVASRDAGVDRFVYAASSATYGDHPDLPKVEHAIGRPLSPYAVSKRVNELYADVFQRLYGLRCTGLRYFNVFGPRQDPNGPYAAVIPRWVAGIVAGETCYINGDGETSRDFCYVENAVQANILVALSDQPTADHEVYNVACGARTTLNSLFDMIRTELTVHLPRVESVRPVYRDFRPGDVRHSLADIGKIERAVEYRPAYSVRDGLNAAIPWYLESMTEKKRELARAERT